MAYISQWLVIVRKIVARGLAVHTMTRIFPNFIMRDRNIDWKAVAIARQQLLKEERSWVRENNPRNTIEINRLNHRIDIYEGLERIKGPRKSKPKNK